MKTMPISLGYSKNQPTFGDGKMPIDFNPTEAMRKLSNNEYILEGENNTKAFSKLYDKVNDTFEQMVNDKKAVYREDYKPTVFGKEPDYVIDKWKMPKEKFTQLLTRFWEDNKQINDISSAVKNFLVNKEGLQAPKWYQVFGSKFAEYVNKRNILEGVAEIFLKSGKHKLK